MKRDAIERLAIDSAAGELSEDTEALLKEYLAEHPEAKKWVLGMQVIYEKTEAAIDEKVKTAYESVVKQPAVIKPSSRLKLLPLIRWAAVIVIASCVGAAIGRWSKPSVLPQQPGPVTVSTGSAIKRPSFDLEDMGEGFWREKVVAMLNSPSTKIQKDYITGPSLWEKYRQYIKERRYE